MKGNKMKKIIMLILLVVLVGCTSHTQNTGARFDDLINSVSVTSKYDITVDFKSGSGVEKKIQEFIETMMIEKNENSGSNYGVPKKQYSYRFVTVLIDGVFYKLYRI